MKKALNRLALATFFAATVSGAAQAAELTQNADAKLNQVVGSLPYSNQWVYDQRQSMLYLSANRLSMNGSKVVTDQYVSDYSSNQFYFPSIDYFMGLFDIIGSDSASPLRGLSVWARYSIGAGARHGSLSNNEFELSAAETVYLTAALFHVGPLLTYTGSSWLQPYVGVEFSPFIYRQSSSLGGAEVQGGGALFGPVAGLHLPLFFSHRASLYGEIRRNNVVSDPRNLFGASTSIATGLGLVF